MAKLTATITCSVRASFLLLWLKRLEIEVPPPLGHHHSLSFAQFGSDEKGWEDRLCLEVRASNGSQKFFLNDQDMVPETFDGLIFEIRRGMGTL